MPRVTEPTTTVATPTPPAPTKRRKKATKAVKRAQQRRNVEQVTRSRSTEANEHFRPQERPRDMPNTGPARIEPLEIEAVTDGPGFKDLADQLTFLNEICEMIVHTTSDKNAEPIPGFWVNGRSQYYPRGQRVKCKRLFVEKVARTVTTNYTQEHYKDALGNDAIRNIPHTSLSYPFTVTHDPSGDKGRAWLEKVLAEA